MKTINLIKVFIASPGDIAAKRNEVEETIYRWNIENTYNTKVILMPIRWETNAVPTYINNSSEQSVDLSQYLGHILVETVTSFLLLPTLQTPVGLDSESSYGFDFGYKTLQCS
nr:hypothetical protein [Enterococcus casseliflavus]